MSRTIGPIGIAAHQPSGYNMLNFSAASTMDITLPLDFKEFLRLLNEKGVEYLLIGGYAVGYYGYPRATNDIDVWIAIAPNNAERVVAALREFGFDTPDLSVGLFLAPNKIVRMGMPPMRIEISTGISGVDFGECYNERVTAEIDGIIVNVISLRHLRINKRASGRYKDLNDLDNLP
jgi:predicted nucleotidyltransferase